jgi:hypothetical protein
MTGLILGRSTTGSLISIKAAGPPPGYLFQVEDYDMHTLNSVGETLKSWIGAIPARAARSEWDEFTCGECERRDRCGLPPDQICIVKAMQIARDGGRPKRRTALTRC